MMVHALTAIVWLLSLASCIQLCSAVVPFSNPPTTSTSAYSVAEFYFKNGFAYKEIVALLMSRHNMRISLRHLKRIFQTLGLRRRGRYIYTRIEEVIEAIVCELGGSGQCLGYRSMWRRLCRDYGITVKRQTVLQLLQIMDPEGITLRKSHKLRRRLYSAKGPNYIWHIDGFDKLKPFGFAIHGCVDGFSRRIIWLEVASSNNNPSLIATYYLEAVLHSGLVPRILRCDAGTENTYIKFLQPFFRHHHSDAMAGMKSFIVGKSTANQQIERWWRSLKQQGIDWWIHLFKDLRDSKTYDSDNCLHIECLKFCFMPSLQAELDRIAIEWNSHGTRKQKNVECPSGKPDVLYFSPQLYTSRDYGHQVDSRDVSICIDNYGSKRTVCSPEFTELINVLLPGLQAPVNVTDSLDLFVALINLFSYI